VPKTFLEAFHGERTQKADFGWRYRMPKGTIRRLIADRGFGFIRTAEGKELFFHRSELVGVQFATLREGQQVEFEVGRGRDSRLQAVRVKLAQPKAE
jgi:CspA family cold shock protein